MRFLSSAPDVRHRFEWRDSVWLLAYPLYQTIGTIRHEGAHAVAILLEGGRVDEFVFWPTWGERFYWGYVRWSGRADWLVSAAPYLLDLITFAVFYLICTRARIRQHQLWVNLAAIGLISPSINSGYRYVSSFFRVGDLTPVMAALPPLVVHAYFILTLALYVLASVRMQRR